MRTDKRKVKEQQVNDVQMFQAGTIANGREERRCHPMLHALKDKTQHQRKDADTQKKKDDIVE